MNRILVALDTSDTANLVLERAIELARATGAKLRLLRVVEEHDERPAASAPEDTNGLVAIAESELLFLAERVPADLRDGIVVEVGRPWDGICKIARSYEADLVVIGAHRYGVIDRVLGTTAARVTNHADRPVLVVRPIQAGRARRRGEPERQDRRTAADLLRSEHLHLEVVYDALLSAYRHGDWFDVIAQWNKFEPSLRAHMDKEEERVFPAFRAANAQAAEALMAEHRELRESLDEIGVGIEIHAVPLAAAEELVRRLRAHGAAEERLLYPWLDATLGAAPLARLSAA